MNRRFPSSSLLVPFAVIAGLLAVHAAPAAAQPRIAAPANGTILRAGTDYATTVLGDAWDMSNVEDVSQFPLGTQNLQGCGFTGQGIWQCTTGPTPDGFFTLLYQGMPPGTILYAGRYGVNAPIVASQYRKVTMKFRKTSASEIPAVRWFKDFAFQDTGVVQFMEGAGVAGWHVVTRDLSSVSNWSGNVLGLRVDPNEMGTLGMAFELDWLRISANDVSTAVTWSGASSTTVVQAVDQAGVVVATIGSGASGSVNWSYDGLPPGTYRLRLWNGSAEQAASTIVVSDPPIIHLTSPDETGGEDWATAVKGNAWDMAASVGQVNWFTKDVQEARYIVPGSDSYATVEGRTVFRATSSAGSPTGDPQIVLVDGSQPGVDAAKYHRFSFRIRVTYPAARDWATTRIMWGPDPVHAHLMSSTWDIMVWNNEFRTYSVDLASLDWNSGIVSGGTGGLWTGLIRQVRLDPLEYPEPTLFEIDDVKLAADAQNTQDGTFAIRWNATGGTSPKVALYYDADTNPGNGMTAIASNLDAAAGSFTWNTASVPLGLYHIFASITDQYGNSQSRYSTGPVRVVAIPPPSIVTLAVARAGSGSGSISSNPPGVSCGADCSESYALGTVVTLTVTPATGSAFAGWSGDVDCLDGQVTMSAAVACTATFLPIVNGGAQGPGGLVDLNGDLSGDVFRYNPATGAWASDVSNQVGGFRSRAGVWAAGWTVRAADFNGDGLTDMFVYNEVTGQWYKCFATPAGDFTYAGGTWSPNWKVFVGDFDGNDRSDVFVYNPSNGGSYTCLTSTLDAGLFSYVAGAWDPGFAIFPADFNGDGRTDLFFYDDTNGKWIRALSTGAGGFAMQPNVWLARGWEIYPGDFDGNGASDLFLYRPTDGRWFICLSNATGFDYVAGQWSPGWTVRTADFDGNDRTDLFVYSPSLGHWFECVTKGTGAGIGFDYYGGVWSPGWQVYVSDFNGDRRSDLLVYSAVNGWWFQCLNSVLGAFAYGGGNWGPGWTIVPVQ